MLEFLLLELTSMVLYDKLEHLGLEYIAWLTQDSIQPIGPIAQDEYRLIP